MERERGQVARVNPTHPMKTLKLFAAFAAIALAVGGLNLNAAEEKAPDKKDAPCCARATAKGETCNHECCATAAKDGKACEKCGGSNAKAS